MLQISKQMQQHTNIFGAMESSDHSKNGASPKSQMSRNYLKLFAFLAFVVGIFIFSSCKESEDDKTIDNVPTSIEGTCWKEYNNKIKLSFENNNEVYLTYQHYDYGFANPYSNPIYEIVKGTYTYSKPNVSINVDGKQWTGKMESSYASNPDFLITLEGKDFWLSSSYDCDRPQKPLSTPNVTATKSGNRIAISWNSVPLATGYKVFRGNNRWDLNKCLDYSVHNTTILYDETPYSEDNYYWVIAYNANGTSNLSHYAYCNFTSGNNNGTDPGTDPGTGNIYAGVMGFHSELMPFAVTNNLSAVKNFINNLQNNQDYTSLCYAVEKSIPMFAASGLPTLDKTFVVSFTDGRDNNSANLWDFNEHITVTDVYAKAQTALLSKSGLRSYAIGLGSQISTSEMQQLVVNGGEYKAATSSSLNAIFAAVANSVLASSKNLVLKTRYSPTAKQFRLTVNASQTSGGSVVTDQIICKIEPQGNDFVMTIVTPGIYTTFDAPVNVTIVNPTSPTRTFEAPLNNLKYVRNGIEYILGDATVEAKTTGDWYTDTEDKVEESNVQKKIAVVLVLDCSTSLGDDFFTLKIAANNFIDILGN
ncbi:MAG: hypothetical protein EZS26_002379 [Candidatus Ordinivivax streblomastigis]|uniref:VWFA domain-containing protein n=1 Tax=Candidatus Ordinivivax streblomastigis TaxID=2540710 RepID=A0A5M8NZD0_9BACT|nr:MAG: hypothetical protein EZS26_002379 [Candidatus Ordinivivax streblomastigis]